MQGMEDELTWSACFCSPLCIELCSKLGTGRHLGSGVLDIILSMEKASGLEVLIMLTLLDRCSLVRILGALCCILLSMSWLAEGDVFFSRRHLPFLSVIRREWGSHYHHRPPHHHHHGAVQSNHKQPSGQVPIHFRLHGAAMTPEQSLLIASRSAQWDVLCQ